MVFSVLVKTAMDEPYESFVKKINLMFNKQLDQLIGKENIDILKEHIEGELFPRYDYLNVFKNNRAVIDENYFKFIDDDKKNPKYKNKTEFTKWVYGEIRKTMEGKNITPSIIYGDSVLGNEVLTLLNNKNELEFHRIDKLCDKWESSDNFKTAEYNEYFTDILNQLFKKYDYVTSFKKLNNNNVLKSDWINSKQIGTIYESKYKNCYIVVIQNKAQNIYYSKKFKYKKNGKTQTRIKAEQYFNEINKTLSNRHRYRHCHDYVNNLEYYEVELLDNIIMKIDIDDMDLIQQYTWSKHKNGTNTYARTTIHNNENIYLHQMVMNKLIKQLPKSIQLLIKSYSIDHINQDTFDNRKRNLRLVTQQEQCINRKIYKHNKTGMSGVYKHKCGLYATEWIDEFDKRQSKYYDNLADAITCKQYQNKLMIQYLDKQREDKIKSIMETIKKDQENRHDKEQAFANYKVWTDKGWSNINRVIRHKTFKRIFRIVTKTSIIDVTEDHSLIDKDGNYVTPKTCTIGTELLYGFNNLTNMNFADIKSNKYDILAFSSDDKVECMKYYCYNRKLGYNVLIDIINDKFVLHRTNDIIDNPNKIINIQQLNDIVDDYVYDLETEVGHFHAGIGEIIVKNTDSVFIKYNIKLNGQEETLKDKMALETSIKLGQLTSKLLFTILPIPQNMLYEKCFHPYVILSKKRYVGNKYGSDPNKYYQDAMGITLYSELKNSNKYY